MTLHPETPTSSYGILKQSKPENELGRIVEQVQLLGYAVLDSGLSDRDLTNLSHDFDAAHSAYVKAQGESRLRETDEFSTIRCPLALGFDSLLNLAFNSRLLAVIDELILGTFILNQQNGIINPPGQEYSQGSWHRDLVYQHFVASRPIAINALFCIDPFLPENGATFVIPASHKSDTFPSTEFIKANAVQISAPAGSFILLDCMTYHAGGKNRTDRPRRAINHIYNIPHFRQQIRIPKLLDDKSLSDKQRQILGFDYDEADSVAAYLDSKRLRS